MEKRMGETRDDLIPLTTQSGLYVILLHAADLASILAVFCHILTLILLVFLEVIFCIRVIDIAQLS